VPSSLSGSGLARALACPAAYALPEAREGSSDATRGTQVHRFLELVSRGEPTSEHLATLDADTRALCGAIDLAEVPTGDGVRTEVALAYNIHTGAARLLAPRGHRDYAGRAATEITGTADLFFKRGTRWVCRDWKTARWDHDVELSRPQLDFYALAWARVHDLDAVTCEVAVIEDSGALRLYAWDHDWETLAGVAERVALAHRRTEEARAAREAHELAHVARWEPDVTVGAHCRYCPAERACPATRALVASLLGEDPATVDASHLGRAYVAAQRAEKAAERARDLAREAAKAGPLPTGDGREVTLTRAGALRLVRSRAA
jgi:hypothetical protein